MKKFELTTEKLLSVQKDYRKIWKIIDMCFPIIHIQVCDSSGIPKLGLYNNLRNFNYLPPYISIMDKSFIKYLIINQIPVTNIGTVDGRKHIYQNQKEGRCWFCTPGTFQYHYLYKEDPWEIIRYSIEGNFLNILNSTINLIDRDKLKEIDI